MTASLSRRGLLGALPCLGMVAAAPRLAFATTATQRDQRFVVVILRGAMDGLSAVAPVGDPDYATLRGALAIHKPGLPGGGVSLGGMFALHPALAPLYPMYQAREMLVLHAMASPYRDRSHFDAQAVVENGTAAPAGAPDGWLNRLMSTMGASHWTGSGFAFGSTVPLMLQGKASVGNWSPVTDTAASTSLQDQAAAMYAPDPLLGSAFAEGLACAALAGQATMAAGLPAFARVAQAAGQILAVDGGPNIATIEAFGWDTHVHQGAATGGLANQLAALAQGLVLMKAGLGARWANTVVVALTEFGRTAVPNGTGGTDHGTAGAGFAFGGAVAGGRVLANWPGLSKGALYQGRDLAPTLDMRSFLKGVLADYFKLSATPLGVVFPGSAAAPPLGGTIRT